MKAQIKADSVNPMGGRITTMLGEYPRFIHSEHLRHRMFSFSVASSRAIPFKRMLKKVETNPVHPIITKNVAGMQGEVCNCLETWEHAQEAINNLAKEAVKTCRVLDDLGVHKQVINRYLEPWLNVSVLFTGTEEAWANFFALRCHEAAEPHISQFAEMCKDEYRRSVPNRLRWGDWHYPFADRIDDMFSMRDTLYISAARCARLSYETHDSNKIDHDKDLDLAYRLLAMKHVSPFEHQAAASHQTTTSGNLRGQWKQFRHCLT